MALDARYDGRLHVVSALPLDSYLSALADADVALALFQPDTPSHRAVIPNKLFEALTAGVPVVASDTPGLRGVLLDDPAGTLGAVCDPTDPKAIAAAIAAIVRLPRAGARTPRALSPCGIRAMELREKARLPALCKCRTPPTS